MSDLIDRQAAIDAVQNRHMMLSKEKVLLINDLEKLPSAQLATDTNVGTKLGTDLAEVGKDCISREQAIKATWQDTGYTDPFNVMTAIRDRIKQLPTIQPKRGKWIKTARWGRVYYCDQCRNYLDFDGVNAGRGSTNFCPNCGADMRGEQDG